MISARNISYHNDIVLSASKIYYKTLYMSRKINFMMTLVFLLKCEKNQDSWISGKLTKKNKLATTKLFIITNYKKLLRHLYYISADLLKITSYIVIVK